MSSYKQVTVQHSKISNIDLAEECDFEYRTLNDYKTTACKLHPPIFFCYITIFLLAIVSMILWGSNSDENIIIWLCIYDVYILIRILHGKLYDMKILISFLECIHVGWIILGALWFYYNYYDDFVISDDLLLTTAFIFLIFEGCLLIISCFRLLLGLLFSCCAFCRGEHIKSEAILNLYVPYFLGKWQYYIDASLEEERLRLISSIGTNNSCLICKKQYYSGEVLRKLPCNHAFHAKCIKVRREYYNTCPLCIEKGDVV